jgi:hypothetical protein
MNEVEINGARIRLKDKIQVEYNSPFVDATELIIRTEVKNPKGAYTISENVMLNAEQLRAMGYPHIFAKQGRQFSFGNCDFRSEGIKVDSANIELMDIERDFDSGVVKGNMTVFFSDTGFLDAVEGKTLRDLTMGGAIAVPKNPNNKTLWPFDTLLTRTAPVKVYPYVEDTILGNPENVGPFTPNHWFNETYDYDTMSGTSYFATQAVLNGHEMVCFPTFVLKRKNNDGDDEDVICNWWDEENQRFYDYSNEWVNAGLFHLDDLGNRISFKNPIIPCYYYHQVIRSCFADFGYTLEPDWLLDDQYFKKAYLKNNYDITIESRYNIRLDDTVGFTFDGIAGLVQEDTEIIAKNHLEDMSIVDFLQDFALSFGINFRITADKKVTIQHLELQKTATSIKDWGRKGKIVNPRLKGITFQYDLSRSETYDYIVDADIKTDNVRETPSTFAAPFAPPLVLGQYGLDQNINEVFNNKREQFGNVIPYVSKDGEKQFELKITPVLSKIFQIKQYNLDDPILHTYSTSFTESDAWLPYLDEFVIQHEGNDYFMTVFPIGDDDPSTPIGTPGSPISEIFWPITRHEGDYVVPELPQDDAKIFKAFYHGLVGGTGYAPAVYPYGSNHNWKPGSGGVELGWFHFGIHGEQGLLNTFHKQMLPVWKSEEYHIFDLKLKWTDIASFQWNQCHIIRGVKYYIGKISFMTPIKDLVKAECYPIYESYE